MSLRNCKSRFVKFGCERMRDVVMHDKQNVRGMNRNAATTESIRGVENDRC